MARPALAAGVVAPEFHLPLLSTNISLSHQNPKLHLPVSLQERVLVPSLLLRKPQVEHPVEHAILQTRSPIGAISKITPTASEDDGFALFAIG